MDSARRLLRLAIPLVLLCACAASSRVAHAAMADVTAAIDSAPASAYPGELITVTNTVTNISAAANTSVPVATAVYLDDDGTVTPGVDTPIATWTTAASGWCSGSASHGA